MKPIASWLVKNLKYSGRMPRAEYLGFLLRSISLYVLALFVAYKFRGQLSFGWMTLGITAVFYLPVTFAGVRRLHDTNNQGALMLDPLKPFAALYFFKYTVLYFANIFPSVVVLIFFMAFFFGQTFLFFYLILIGIVTIVSLVYFSNTMSKLLLPSDPNANQFGPNPHEVTP